MTLESVFDHFATEGTDGNAELRAAENAATAAWVAAAVGAAAVVLALLTYLWQRKLRKDERFERAFANASNVYVDFLDVVDGDGPEAPRAFVIRVENKSPGKVFEAYYDATPDMNVTSAMARDNDGEWHPASAHLRGDIMRLGGLCSGDTFVFRLAGELSMSEEDPELISPKGVFGWFDASGAHWACELEEPPRLVGKFPRRALPISKWKIPGQVTLG